jgi:hypothetical protein
MGVVALIDKQLDARFAELSAALKRAAVIAGVGLADSDALNANDCLAVILALLAICDQAIAELYGGAELDQECWQRLMDDVLEYAGPWAARAIKELC